MAAGGNGRSIRARRSRLRKTPLRREGKSMQAIRAKGQKLFLLSHNYGPEGSPGCFSYTDKAILECYYHKSIFGDFQFSGALRPDILRPFIPGEGFVSGAASADSPRGERCIQCCVDSSRLMEVFFVLVGLLPDAVSMVMEEIVSRGKPRAYQNDRMEKVIATSRLVDFEDFFIGDGFSGIGFFSDETDEEIFADEHKLIYIYTRSQEKYIDALRSFALAQAKRLSLISEYPHIHFRTSGLGARKADLKRAFCLESCAVSE